MLVDRDKIPGGAELEKELDSAASHMMAYMGLQQTNQRIMQMKRLIVDHGMGIKEAEAFCMDKLPDIIDAQIDRLSAQARLRECIYCAGRGRLTTMKSCFVCGGSGKLDSRPSWDVYFMSLLPVIKSRASCSRRQVGAVIVDVHHNLISTGYNGPPTGLPNCTENPCGGQNDQSGDNTNCMALHAEHNAIYYAGDRKSEAHTLYCTTEPCDKCALEILQTPIKRVIYQTPYPSDGRTILIAGGVQFETFASTLIKNEGVKS